MCISSRSSTSIRFVLRLILGPKHGVPDALNPRKPLCDALDVDLRLHEDTTAKRVHSRALIDTPACIQYELRDPIEFIVL